MALPIALPALVLVVSALVQVPPSSEPLCDEASFSLGLCNPDGPDHNNDGDGIDVWDEINVPVLPPTDSDEPGEAGPGDSDDGSWMDDPGADPEIPPGIVPGPDPLEDCRDNWEEDRSCFMPGPPPTDPAPDPGTPDPGPPPITISDLIRFVPTHTTVVAEPGNAGVAGLPANIVSDAKTEVVAASLFGFPFSVRFVPASFDFDYGDGGFATTTTPGAPWEVLGQAQFTPTPTSHVFADRGEFTTSVTIHYAADIDLGSGWMPVGIVTGAPVTQSIRIFEARTALVDGSCNERPTAPGC